MEEFIEREKNRKTNQPCTPHVLAVRVLTHLTHTREASPKGMTPLTPISALALALDGSCSPVLSYLLPLPLKPHTGLTQLHPSRPQSGHLEESFVSEVLPCFSMTHV